MTEINAEMLVVLQELLTLGVPPGDPRSDNHPTVLKARAAIAEAALRQAAAAAEAKPVAVKALEWEYRQPSLDEPFWRAQTPFDWGYRVSGEGSDWLFEYETHDTLEAAKASAQADFERRILTALATPPAASDAYAAGEAAGIERAAKVAEATRNHDDGLQAAYGGTPCGKRIAAALRSLKPEGAPPVERVQPGDGWELIATAPKNGAPVDLWSGTTRYPDCFWSADEYETPHWCQRYSEATGSSFGLDDITPTHWRYPPAPPAGNGG